MALNRKYAALPDLDSAPDIYETPELTDDNSTVPTTTVRSQSDDDFDEEDGDEDDEDDMSGGVSRSRLQISQARARFLPANVDASTADFSDRVDGKRKSYKTSTRRQRFLDDGTEELGELSDDDEVESLERRIARLKREVEEAKEEYGKQQATSGKAGSGGGEAQKLVSLSQALDEMTRPSHAEGTGFGRGPLHTQPQPTTESRTQPEAHTGDGATYTVTYAATYEQSHALAKAADFDRRLVLLEKAIGVSSSALTEVDANGLPRAIMPTLEGLQKQISTLSQASTASLDSISRRVRTLTQEAEQLEKARQGAKSAQEALGTGGPTADGAEDVEQAAKINALYGTLPTIESLAPLLPPLLDRLRSLRAIHSEAAHAGETLGRIEQQQTEMAAELKQWREGLQKMEEAMKQSDASMGTNAKVMESWVKELEQRMGNLH